MYVHIQWIIPFLSLHFPIINRHNPLVVSLLVSRRMHACTAALTLAMTKLDCSKNELCLKVIILVFMQKEIIIQLVF